ncbi:hypothetical protein CAMSH0001_2168 [Campylobacter showae RM3277]|uniref:Uncharacterized protein n=1 Tax=Campylobacter showae RM3277 TaxID=553219 RepID=C6RFQ6_9BACT|nr:hypothetical protein CAMSH0001_2168 [Campylobacter showae RM3277]
MNQALKRVNSATISTRFNFIKLYLVVCLQKPVRFKISARGIIVFIKS